MGYPMILRQPINLINYCLLSNFRSLKTNNLQRKIIKQLNNQTHLNSNIINNNNIKFKDSNRISISPIEYKWWIRLKPLIIFLLIQSIPLSIGAYFYKRLLDSKIDLLNTPLNNTQDILTHCIKVIRSSTACFLLVSTTSTSVQLVDTLNPNETISLDTILSDITRNSQDISVVFPISLQSHLINLNSPITLLYYNSNKSSIVYISGIPEKIERGSYWKNSWSSNVTPSNFDLYKLTPTTITTCLFGCGDRDWQHYSIKRTDDKWSKI